MSPQTTSPRPGLVQRLEVPGEALLVAVLLAVLCLPVVTALAAAAAGSAQLSDLVERGRRPSAAAQLRLTYAALRSHPVVWVAPLAWVVVAATDIVAMLGGLPGTALLAPLVVAALGAALLVGLRAASRWQPGAEWPRQLSQSASRAIQDVRGTLLMVFALAVGAGLVALLPAIVVLVPGMLVVVAVAVARGDPA
jgi:hypothetical protein